MADIDPIDPTDPRVILDQIYTAVKKKQPKVDKLELGEILADIRILTTIQGASTLEIDVIDTEWVLLTSGFLDIGDDQKLDPVDLNYPLGSNFWWRLTQCDSSTDKDKANLTLTFEDRAVSYCRSHKGAKSASRSTMTRARFIKSITADEVKAPPRLIFVSPEIDAEQPIAVP
jgi:hypothetical protein